MRVWFKRIHSNGIYGLDDGTSTKLKQRCTWEWRRRKGDLWLAVKKEKEFFLMESMGQMMGQLLEIKQNCTSEEKEELLVFAILSIQNVSSVTNKSW